MNTPKIFSYFCLSLMLSACGTSTITPSISASANALQATAATQRYVHLSVPIQTTPKQQIYVLNADKSQQVAYWTTVTNSLTGIAPPYPYFVLPLTPGTSTTFYLVVPQSATQTYKGCSLTFDAQGVINTSAADSCVGTVAIPNSNYQHQTLASLVSVYNLGANFGNSLTVNAAVLNQQVAPASVPRTLTFINNTQRDLCFVNQTSGNSNAAPVPAQMCDETYQTQVLSGGQVVFPISDSGLNSAAWIVAGYRESGAKTWIQTGFVNPNRNQAATKIELTAFPYYPSGVLSGPIVNSVGPTNVDISSVDGINLLYKFYPTPSTTGGTAVCTLANNNVTPATQYTGVYSQGAPMSYFANTDDSGNFSCQSSNAYNQGSELGCASNCTMAYVNNDSPTKINQQCCIGSSYGTQSTCVASDNPLNPANSKYTALVHQQFINSYSFAYDDAKADFSCDPLASFVIEIDGVGQSILTS